jgi:hypothetical protein
MAKSKSIGNANKISFGKRKGGKPNGKKAYGPKDQTPKPYRSQGR